MKCTCGTLMITLSNGYTICETCRDARDNMRIERDDILSQRNEAVERLATMTALTKLKYGNLDAGVWQEIEATEKFIVSMEVSP